LFSNGVQHAWAISVHFRVMTGKYKRASAFARSWLCFSDLAEGFLLRSISLHTV
jgi:hypothetical protein